MGSSSPGRHSDEVDVDSAKEEEDHLTFPSSAIGTPNMLESKTSPVALSLSLFLSVCAYYYTVLIGPGRSVRILIERSQIGI